MPSPRILADYDSLAMIARAFGREAASARQTLNNLRRHMETLQNGDWIGRGATAFYREMDGALLPSMQRLAAALETAERVTARMSQIMRAAEEEASAAIRSGLDGATGTTASSGGDDEDIFAGVLDAFGRPGAGGAEDDEDMFAGVLDAFGRSAGPAGGEGGASVEAQPETSPASPETPSGGGGGDRNRGQGGAGGVGGASLEGGEGGPQRDPLAPRESD